MGIFDFFVSSEKQKAKSTHQSQARPFNFTPNGEQQQNNSSRMQLFYPKSFDDVSEIINLLSLGKPAFVNISDLKEETSQRVLDLLSGAIYALHGGLCEVQPGLYYFSIDGIQRN